MQQQITPLAERMTRLSGKLLDTMPRGSTVFVNAEKEILKVIYLHDEHRTTTKIYTFEEACASDFHSMVFRDAHAAVKRRLDRENTDTPSTDLPIHG